MKDLLKEAIADAKAVRETALANAKLALEEAFAPRIQSMISSHLSEMNEDETLADDEMMDDEMTDTGAEEMPAEEPEMPAEEPEMPAEEMPAEESEKPVDEMDLAEIIRELEEDDITGEGEYNNEDEIPEGEYNNEDEMPEGEYNNEDEMPKDEYDNEDEIPEDEYDNRDENIDINEIIRSLREEEGEAEPVEADKKKEEELKEAYKVIKFLRSKINEVNLLNAKLLYSNKLFRGYSLNESQKLKVIENFDRAHSLREVKLLYTALAENFAGTKGKKVVKESFASKPVASTKPTKTVLNEGEVLANRFKKLAGLIK